MACTTGSCPLPWASGCSNSPISQSTSCASSTAATRISTKMGRSTPSRASSPAIWIDCSAPDRAARSGSANGRSSKCRIGLADLAADAGESLLRRRIFVVDIERLRIGAGGLVLLPETLVSEPPAAPGPHILRIELHRIVEIARRRLIVADGEIAERARDPRFCIVVFEADGGREIVDGELVLLPALIQQAAIVIGVG